MAERGWPKWMASFDQRRQEGVLGGATPGRGAQGGGFKKFFNDWKAGTGGGTGGGRVATLSALLLGVASFAAISLGGATPAFASTVDCGTVSPTHCYSVTHLDTGPGWLGGHIAMALLPMATGGSSSSADYHVGNTLWLNLNSSHTDAIEAGLEDMWAQPNGYNNCSNNFCQSWSYEAGNGGSQTCVQSGCGAYFLYWADRNLVGGTEYEHVHVVRFTSPQPAGTTQYIDIINNYDQLGNWNINFSGYYTYSSSSTINDQYTGPSDVEAGGEVSAPANAADCATNTTDTVGLWEPGLSILFPNTDGTGTPGGSWHVTSGSGLTGTPTSNGSGSYTWKLNGGC